MTRISVLQLDTHFPRIAGDVGCPDTYKCALEIIRVPKATVRNIVTDAPDQIDLRPFYEALATATGDVITTSCGFLAPFQNELSAQCRVPFIASALGQLAELKNHLTPQKLQIITFNASKLGRAHLPDGCEQFQMSISGLGANSHMRDVIENDRVTLNSIQAAKDVCAALRKDDSSTTKGILLECTNLPPYKPDIRKRYPVPIYDILTAIDAQVSDVVHPRYL